MIIFRSNTFEPGVGANMRADITLCGIVGVNSPTAVIIEDIQADIRVITHQHIAAGKANTIGVDVLLENRFALVHTNPPESVGVKLEHAAPPDSTKPSNRGNDFL